MTLNDTTILKGLRKDIMEALGAVEAKHGIKFATGKCTYEGDGSQATFKLVASAPDKEGKIKDQAEKDFERLHYLYHGLKPEHLHSNVTWGKMTYEIVGLRPRAHQYPIVGVCNGKRYRLPLSAVIGRGTTDADDGWTDTSEDKLS